MEYASGQHIMSTKFGYLCPLDKRCTLDNINEAEYMVPRNSRTSPKPFFLSSLLSHFHLPHLHGRLAFPDVTYP